MAFREISPFDLKENPFDLIGNQWMLITAGNREKINTMTASWGGLGILWGKPVATCYIRPQRYTKEFVDANETLSLTMYPSQYREKLSYLGKVSGRDEPKIEKAELTPLFDGDTPYFEEAKLVLLCRKLYLQYLKPECFLDSALNARHYNNDHHAMVICEIEKVLTKS